MWLNRAFRSKYGPALGWAYGAFTVAGLLLIWWLFGEIPAVIFVGLARGVPEVFLYLWDRRLKRQARDTWEPYV
jgi:hypothetical protein